MQPIEVIEELLSEALDVADDIGAPLLAAKIDDALTCAHEMAAPRHDPI